MGLSSLPTVLRGRSKHTEVPSGPKGTTSTLYVEGVITDYRGVTERRVLWAGTGPGDRDGNGTEESWDGDSGVKTQPHTFPICEGPTPTQGGGTL